MYSFHRFPYLIFEKPSEYYRNGRFVYFGALLKFKLGSRDGRSLLAALDRKSGRHRKLTTRDGDYKWRPSTGPINGPYRDINNGGPSLFVKYTNVS